MQFQTIRLTQSDSALASQLTMAMLGESPASNDALAELLEDQRNIVLACVHDSAPVGYLIAHQFPSLAGDRLVYLYDIEVSESYRRLGIGTSLVQKLMEVCRSNNVDSVWVGSSLDNEAACALWEQTGATRESDQYAEFTYAL